MEANPTNLTPVGEAVAVVPLVAVVMVPQATHTLKQVDMVLVEEAVLKERPVALLADLQCVADMKE